MSTAFTKQSVSLPLSLANIANPETFSAYGAGTPYSLTTTPAAIDLGTTDPSITITTAGTYLIMARAKVDYAAATFAAVRTATLKLRRTNNTAADLTGGSTALKTQIITALTYTAGTVMLPPVLYTTATTDDVITVFGGMDTGPTAGTIDVSECEILAIRIY